MREEAVANSLPQFPQWNMTSKLSEVMSRNCAFQSRVSDLGYHTLFSVSSLAPGKF